MRWAVAYYEGSLPLVWRDSQEFVWSALPPGDGVTTGVAWVDVRDGGYHHRLMGRDYYWLDVANGTFGLFNDPDNLDWYGGNPDEQASA